MSDVREAAMEALRVFYQRRMHYDAVNEDIKVLQPDFPSLITMIDSDVERAVVKALDAVLGDEIASYFLYEVPGMEKHGGGKIVETDGVEWPIRTFEDVEAYMARQS